MDLKFEKINNWFVSEFEVTQDFNIHIEKEAGSILFYQRTAGSEYDIIHDLGPHKGNERVMDLDFSTFIYPKYIKIKSKVLPTVATITTDGEVHELVYQEKSVEITSNGTTKVTADTGYTALGSVNVKVNVPTEGGGGDSASSFEYLDVTNVTGMNGQLKDLVLQMAYMGKVPQTVKVGSKTLKQGISPISGYMGVAGSFQAGTEEYTQATNAITAISIDYSATINMQGQALTIQEVFAMYGVQSYIDAIPRITKEEFYNLSNIIKFSINNEYYFAKEGMTWQQFAMSGYNNYNNEQRVQYEESYQAILYDGNPIVGDDGTSVDPHTEIISGANYTSAEVG